MPPSRRRESAVDLARVRRIATTAPVVLDRDPRGVHRRPPSTSVRRRQRSWPARCRRRRIEPRDRPVDVVRYPDRAERPNERRGPVPTACACDREVVRVDEHHPSGATATHTPSSVDHAGGCPSSSTTSDRPDADRRGAARRRHHLPPRAPRHRRRCWRGWRRRGLTGHGPGLRSIWLTVPSPAFVTQTEPSPIAMPEGDDPTSMVSLRVPSPRRAVPPSGRRGTPPHAAEPGGGRPGRRRRERRGDRRPHPRRRGERPCWNRASAGVVGTEERSRWRRARARRQLHATVQRRDRFGTGGVGVNGWRARPDPPLPGDTNDPTGSGMFLNVRAPRSSYRMPSRRRARW